MHIWFCIFVHIFCIFLSHKFLHTCHGAYFVFAYFSIFTLLCLQKPMSIINIQTAADALLCYASAASFANCFFLSYSAPYFLQSSSYASEQPKRRWSCLGQGCSKRCWTVESAAAGTWSWFSHGRLIPLRLVFHVFSKLLFSLVVVMMYNPQSLFTLHWSSVISPSCSGEVPCWYKGSAEASWVAA